MGIDELITSYRDEILAISARHGVRNVRVFGSVVRNEARPDSDIDFLVDVGPKTSSWFPAGFILDLKALLGREVDVVTEKGLHAFIRDEVMREAVAL